MPHPHKIAVIGAGSFGSAIAHYLAQHGLAPHLWARSESISEEINCAHTNRQYLDNATLSNHITATSNMAEALQGSRCVIIAVPSTGLREVLRQCAPHIDTHNTYLISTTKGIEADSLHLASELIADELPTFPLSRLILLSGPSFAREIINAHPTSVVLASTDIQSATYAQAMLSSSVFRCYTNHDVIGVELAGALKNVFAIAAGAILGLGLGANTRAALLSRSLNEMVRLGLKMNAEPLTFLGLAGVGDLVLTCTSPMSRNMQVGIALAEGKKLPQIIHHMKMVAEGVRTSQAAYQLAQKYGVKMPIIEQVYLILHKDKDVKRAVEDAMICSQEAEWEFE